MSLSLANIFIVFSMEFYPVYSDYIKSDISDFFFLKKIYYIHNHTYNCYHCLFCHYFECVNNWNVSKSLGNGKGSVPILNNGDVNQNGLMLTGSE